MHHQNFKLTCSFSSAQLAEMTVALDHCFH
jgi:hypothetical protein